MYESDEFESDSGDLSVSSVITPESNTQQVVCAHPFISLCPSLPTTVCLPQSVSLPTTVCQSVCLPQSVSLSAYHSLPTTVCQSVYLPVVCQSFCLLVCLP